MTLQWITMNPETKEGVVLAPPVPPAEAKYEQALEWAALRHLMLEIREAGGGDTSLNEIYIRACQHYIDKWKAVTEPVAQHINEPDD
jgi:hypothetical protein